MPSLYAISEFVHVVAAIVYVGGAFTLTMLNAQLAQSGDRALLRAMGEQVGRYGSAVLGPTSMVVLLAGVAMVVIGNLGWPLWIIWGLLGIFLSQVLGGIFIQQTTTELAELAASAPTDPRLALLQRRLVTLNWANLVLLLTVVAAMVFKPAL